MLSTVDNISLFLTLMLSTVDSTSLFIYLMPSTAVGSISFSLFDILSKVDSIQFVHLSGDFYKRQHQFIHFYDVIDAIYIRQNQFLHLFGAIDSRQHQFIQLSDAISRRQHLVYLFIWFFLQYIGIALQFSHSRDAVYSISLFSYLTLSTVSWHQSIQLSDAIYSRQHWFINSFSDLMLSIVDSNTLLLYLMLQQIALVLIYSLM